MGLRRLEGWIRKLDNHSGIKPSLTIARNQRVYAAAGIFDARMPKRMLNQSRFICRFGAAVCAKAY